MTILDAITSSPINVFFTIVIGIGLAYLYYRKPSSSSSSTSTNTQSLASHRNHFPVRAFLHNQSGYTRSSGLDNGVGVVDEELQRAIAQIERQERNMIRQEQDEAYQQSLKADREKKLKREEEQRDREAKEKAERERKDEIERLHQRLTKLKSDIVDRLPFDKSTTEASPNDVVKLVFKLPDGTRVKQDFRKQDKVKYLHWFVFSLKNAPLQFRLTTNFPKRDLPGRPPLPEDFDEPNQKEEKSSATQTMNSTSSNTSNGNKPEPNCELTLAEAHLTETQIIFVYDLEA